MTIPITEVSGELHSDFQQLLNKASGALVEIIRLGEELGDLVGRINDRKDRLATLLKDLGATQSEAMNRIAANYAMQAELSLLVRKSYIGLKMVGSANFAVSWSECRLIVSQVILSQKN